MSKLTESENPKPGTPDVAATALFSNRCPIQFGFFSVPAFHHTADPLTKKIIRLVNYADDGIEQFINIEAFPETGLPTTSDLTLYLAFQKLLDENYKYLRSGDERIYFSKTDLLEKIGLTDGSANLVRISAWGQRMKETAIRFFENEERKKVFGTFGIFQEFITKKMLLEDDSIAQDNWIRLTKWEIDNRINKPLIPIDFSTYLKIENKTAQLLIPHLQVWLYASQNSKIFRKNYTELCLLLGLKPAKYLAHAQRPLEKAFKLLIQEEYIARADIYESKNNGEFIVELVHGKKFFRDKAAFQLLEGGQQTNNKKSDKSDMPDSAEDVPTKLELLPKDEPNAILTDEQAILLKKLIGKEIDVKDAAEIVLTRNGEDVEMIVRYCEHLFTEQPKKFKSQRGYLFTLLKDSKFKVPESFITEHRQREKNAREASEAETELNRAERESEKLNWLQEQFDEFSFQATVSQSPADYSQFLKSYEKGSQIWESLLSQLQKSLNEQVFDAWFRPLNFAGLIEEDSTLQITATAVAQDWIERYYAKQITQILNQLNLSDYKLSWIVRDLRSDEEMDEFSLYRLTVIDRYRQSGGISFDEFCRQNRKDLDKRFSEI